MPNTLGWGWWCRYSVSSQEVLRGGVKDLARARRALSFGDYPSFVFYSQQAITELMVGLSICEYL
jgi:HEPN domain-containing protein